ncbi:MAG: hypothetical protein ACJAVV_002106 [Alphaproteobacteria bacterium]|jgi:hypothetical protein
MSVADVLNIKSDAPTTYVVTKGDTLWDISNLFLDKPWLWPELWRNNIQIENPHLIYPGDTLLLRYENGKPVIELVRDINSSRDKNTVVLSPESRVVNKRSPISVLPWSIISPFIKNDSMMDAEQYKELPTLLGDNLGTPRFSTQDYVLAHKLPDVNATYQVIRKVREVIDSSGKNLGLQISHLSDAQVSNSLSNERQIVRLTASTMEAKQGDKLKPKTKVQDKDLTLAPAQAQVGELVQNINGNSLISMRDIVIVNLGANQVSPGTVFGIYHRGPDILASDEPEYADDGSLLDMLSLSERVTQPAFKVGELVIIKSFENASYAWVTKAETHLTGGELIAKPY